MLKFFGHEVVLGQVNALLAVIVVLALLAIRRGRETAAGLLVALAVVVKPYAIIFLPWLVARRRLRPFESLGTPRAGRGAIAAAIAGLAAVAAAPALVYGVRGNIELHRAWWRTVTESTAPNLTNADNVSIAAMYAKWIGAGQTATVLTFATIAIAARGRGIRVSPPRRRCRSRKGSRARCS